MKPIVVLAARAPEIPLSAAAMPAAPPKKPRRVVFIQPILLVSSAPSTVRPAALPTYRKFHAKLRRSFSGARSSEFIRPCQAKSACSAEKQRVG